MKLTKTIVSALLALMLMISAFGCAAPAAEEAVEQPAVEEAEQTKPVLLAVSFGTSYDNLDASIGGVEAALAAAYPEYELRRAFTAQTVIDIIAERDGIETDNVTEAMDRLVADGVKEVVIQPTHVMNGFEYDDMMKEVAPYADKFDSMKIGKAILTTDDDFAKLIASITEETAEYNNEETAVVFMGHGTHHEQNAVYSTLQQKLAEAGYTNYFIGTVEAAPALEDVMAAVKETGAKKVVLLPLMIVAGDHANNDMAGDEEDSWKTAFINAGYEVECVLKGLGEYAGVQQIIVEHAAADQ